MQTLGGRWELLYIATGNPQGHGNRQGRATRAGPTSATKKEVGTHLLWVLVGETTCPSMPLTAECDGDTAQAPAPTCHHPQSRIFPSSCPHRGVLPAQPSAHSTSIAREFRASIPRDHSVLVTGGQAGEIKLGPTGSAI